MNSTNFLLGYFDLIFFHSVFRILQFYVEITIRGKIFKLKDLFIHVKQSCLVLEKCTRRFRCCLHKLESVKLDLFLNFIHSTLIRNRIYSLTLNCVQSKHCLNFHWKRKIFVVVIFHHTSLECWMTVVIFIGQPNTWNVSLKDICLNWSKIVDVLTHRHKIRVVVST